MASEEEPLLLKDLHIKYWLRCAKTFLPHHYTSSDSSRMSLAFFIVSALDILDLLDAKVTGEERQGWIDWIYHCQFDEGGFKGFTGGDLGASRDTTNLHWDPATVPATFFALVTLLILGDDLRRVKRFECLRWLPKLQRDNGSFGEILDENETIQGGSDLRFCYCASGIRYVLRSGAPTEPLLHIPDFDTEKLLDYIDSCQTYEGGFSEGPYHEAHSGLTYCAIGALSFLKQIPSNTSEASNLGYISGISLQNCCRWIIHRQTTYIEDNDDDASDITSTLELSTSEMVGYLPHLGPVYVDRVISESEQESATVASLEDIEEVVPRYAGFNGRPNKIADTCYGFWNTGALSILGRSHLIDSRRLRRYLLEKVQHIVGGFGKGVDEPPDIYHAYLGLVTLSLMDEPGLREADATFCISSRARRNLQGCEWWSQ